jgi:hypothetical protein
MLIRLVSIAVLALSVSGQPKNASGDKHPTSDKQQPAPVTTYAHDSNCCTTQASQKPDTKPTRWYASLERPDWWIVILAALTGGFVGWQAWETRKASDAAAKQASIQREMLRPRLTVSNFVNDVYGEAAIGKRVFIALKISNSGGMPAYGVSVETWIEFLQRGPMECPYQFSSEAKHNLGATINVDTANPQGFEIPFNRSLNDIEIHQMRNALGAICFRIRLEYLAFSERVHTEHAFAMEPGVAVSIAQHVSAT